MRIFKTFAAAFAALGLTAGMANAVVIGGFDGSRTLASNYSIYGATSATDDLTNFLNAFLYGDTITFGASTATATASYLDGIDIFFTGLVPDSRALSVPEVTALTDFVNDGGVVIVHGDNLDFDIATDAFLNNFGLDVENSTNNSTPTEVVIDNASHPIMDGPFGTVGNHTVEDSAYLAAPSGDAQNIASYAATIFGAVGVVDPGTGRLGGVLFLPDSETYGLTNAGYEGQSDAQTLFNNGVAWAVDIANTPVTAVPVPATLPLMIGAVALLGCWRRSQQG